MDDNGCQNIEIITVNNNPTISGNSPICGTGTVQLTGSGTPDGTTPWASSNTGVATVNNTGLVTGVSAGTTTITYTDANGCQVTTIVTVNALPTISGNAPICIGASVQLTGSGIPDGTTPWTSSNPLVGTVSNTGLVNGLTAGTTTITYLDNNGCQNTVVVIVNGDPTISGTTTICSGSTSTLTGSGTPDATTPWASSNTAVGTIDNSGVVTAVSAGTTTITYTNNAGCQTTAVVTVNDLPTVSGATDLCGTATISLTGSGTPDGTTPWISSNTGIATVDNAGNVTGVSAGTTTITYTDVNGCQASQIVTVNAIPTISGGTPLCVNSTVLLTGSGTPDGTTPWSTSSPAVATVSAGGLVTAVSGGTTTITYMDDNGCQNTETITVNDNPTISGNAPICGTGTVQLTGSGTPNGTTPWSSSNAGVATVNGTGLVTGVSAGTATITYLDINGCQVTATVTINALPTISGNAPICIGASLQLTGSGIPDGATPWASSNPSVATISNTGLVNGLTAGTTTITYLDDNGCQNTVVVTVNSNPTIAGTTTICSGSTSTLTGSGTPDATTPWTSSNSTVATIDNSGVVTAVSSGTTIITYTNDGGCQVTATVTVNNVPTISGSLDICGTSTTSLTGSGTPDGTTPWTSSNTGVATVDNSGNVTGVSAGTTTITYLDANGCQASQVVTVNDNPTISGVTPICTGATLQLTGSGTPDATTPWSSSNPGVASIDASGLITSASPGSVVITYLDANGCQTTETITVLASPVLDPVLDQTICDVFVLPTYSGSNLTANVSYWTAAGGTGTALSPGDPITSTMTLFIYDANGGCTSEVSFTITINPAPVLDVVNDTIVCGSFDLPTILGQDLTGTEAYYDDSQANGGTVLSGPLTASQTIWIYDGSGSCSDETSFILTVNALPTASVSGGGVYCEGDVIGDILVDVTGNPDWTINYTLDGVPQVATGSTSPVSVGNTEGVYVLVDVADVSCSSTASGSETISITPTPGVPNAGTDAEYCSTATLVDLTVSGNGGIFTWYDDVALSNSIGSGVTLTPENTTGVSTYYVTETINGCEGPSSSVIITVVECDISVPTAFTPNGDNAHDTWELINLDEAYPNSIVRVFNRWGNILFESEQGNYNDNVWDGTFKGEVLPVGSYYFIIELNNDEQESITGAVTIVLE
jgi:gliding motility-associated-like protein